MRSSPATAGLLIVGGIVATGVAVSVALASNRRATQGPALLPAVPAGTTPEVQPEASAPPPAAAPAPAPGPAPAAAPAPAPAPAPAAAAPPAPAPSGPPVYFTQKQICDAFEASITDGNVTPLAEIGRLVQRMPPELRAYVTAAGRRAQAYHTDRVAWAKDFGKAAKAQAAKTELETKTALGIAGVVAGAVNAIPVVGQAVSAVLTVGILVATALTQGLKLEARDASAQLLPAYEGLSVFRGLGVIAPENPYEDAYLVLKQRVVQDPVAFSLPVVPYGTAFTWAPKLADFVEAAHELGLYPEDPLYSPSAPAAAPPAPSPPPVSPLEGSLVRGDGQGAVYLIENGLKRWVVNEEVLKARFGGWDSVRDVSQAVLTPMPYGDNIKS